MIDWSFQSQLTRYAPQLSVHHWMVLESGACGERERERESRKLTQQCASQTATSQLYLSLLWRPPHLLELESTDTLIVSKM